MKNSDAILKNPIIYSSNYFLLVLSSLLCHPSNIQAKSALCFLTYVPARATLQFAEELAQNAVQYDVDVFIMTDNQNFNLSAVKTSSNLRLLHISNKECVLHGYRKTISLTDKYREITSWDKALLYFCILNKNYSFIWLVENDVFIPSVQAFRSVHQLYSNNTDLIIPRNGLNLLGNTSSWLWHMTVGKFVPPWACSMVNIVGLSRRMLTAINDYVQWRGEVPFHEFFFNTLAIQLNLTMRAPTELSTIVYSATYSLEQIYKQPNNFWHPFKHLSLQNSWRKRLADENSKNNNSIQLSDLEMSCDNKTSSMESIETRLKNLLINFEIIKSRLSSNMRLAMRQHFSYLAEQCQKRSATKEVVSLAMQLANHAYKLPEPPVEELVTKQSSNHLRLEQALKENKEAIFRLLSNSSNLHQLREQVTYLINELTAEIKEEFKQQKLQNQTQLSSPLISSNEINRTLYKLRRSKVDYFLDSGEDKMKIRFLVFFIFCTLFVILWWQDVQERKYFVFIFICLLFIFSWYNL